MLVSPNDERVMVYSGRLSVHQYYSTEVGLYASEFLVLLS